MTNSDLPPGCNGDGTLAPAGQRGRTGCLHHYPPDRNLAAEGCICPAWFDGGGWHLIEHNPACTAHQTVPEPGSRVYCTMGHQPGEHDITCLPPAEPGNPELRLLRAIFGLCPDCDNGEQWHLDHPDAHDEDQAMTGTSAGFDHQSDALLAIDRALTEAERAAFLAYVAAHWPRLIGADVADVLDITTGHDAFLDRTEPFYEAHEPELEGFPAVTPVLHALIILGAGLTTENVAGLLARAGLAPGVQGGNPAVAAAPHGPEEEGSDGTSQ